MTILDRNYICMYATLCGIITKNRQNDDWSKKRNDYKSLNRVTCWHLACCKLWRECSYYYYYCIVKIIIYQLNKLITTRNVHINSVPLLISTRAIENMNRNEKKKWLSYAIKKNERFENEFILLFFFFCWLLHRWINIRICSFERTVINSVHMMLDRIN